ncbi:tetraspanin-4 isoform X1 [Dermacentor albipictus]
MAAPPPRLLRGRLGSSAKHHARADDAEAYPAARGNGGAPSSSTALRRRRSSTLSPEDALRLRSVSLPAWSPLCAQRNSRASSVASCSRRAARGSAAVECRRSQQEAVLAAAAAGMAAARAAGRTPYVPVGHQQVPGVGAMGRTGYTCVRRTLCCYNLLFWILGCGVTGVGVWLHVAYGGYSTLLPTHRVLSADGLCLTAGAITFLVAFLGCCGAWFQSRCMLATYFVLVILIFLLEFAAGTLGFIYRRHIGQSLMEELKVGIEHKYDPDSDNGLAELWDQIHTKFECCGVHSYRDWHRISAWPNEEWVPQSCCLEEFVNGTACATSKNPRLIHEGGCYRKLHLWIMKRLYIVGIVCMSFAFVQLFGLISAMLLLCTSAEKKKKKKYNSRYIQYAAMV